MDDKQTNKNYPRIIGNTWEPTDNRKPWLQYIDDWHANINETIERIALPKSKKMSYIDKQILKALKELANMPDIVIKPADKNLGPVILTRRQYEVMCMDHLSNPETYRVVDNHDPNSCYSDLERILEKHNMRYIQYGSNSNKRQKRETQLARSICQLKNSPLLREAYFYCNPKMHKGGVIIRGRPIVSSINSFTYHTSIYLHNVLVHVMKYLTTTVASSQEALIRIQNARLNNNSVLLCADVTSLYPSIPIEYGLSAVQKMLELVTQRQLMNINIPLIMDLLRWVLTNNYFTFNNTTYQQLTGTAMGTPIAPVYANIVLFWIDVKCCETKIPMYMRYLDDIFAVANNEQQATDTVQTFNAQCPTLKLESVTIGTSGVFLDLDISIRDNRMITKVYQKAINKYLYLKPTTCHAKNVIKNFILQELNRYRLICTNDNDYRHMVQLFTQRLAKRAHNVRHITATVLPLVGTRDQLLNKIASKAPSKQPGKLTPIFIINQTIKDRLKRNGYSPKTIFALPEQLANNFEFLRSYPNFASSGILFGTTNSKSVSNYIIRAKYPKPDVWKPQYMNGM